MRRECPTDGCARSVSREGFLCTTCWFYLGGNLRQLLARTARREGIDSDRYAQVLETCRQMAHRAAVFIERATENGPGEGGDVFASDYRPGRRLRQKAVWRACATGESFDEALEFIVRAIKGRQVAEIARNAGTPEEQARREARRIERRLRWEQEEAAWREHVSQTPRSVWSVPVPFESSRRRH